MDLRFEGLAAVWLEEVGGVFVVICITEVESSGAPIFIDGVVREVLLKVPRFKR